MLTPHPNPYIIEPDPALSRGETGGTVLVIACVAAIAAGHQPGGDAGTVLVVGNRQQAPAKKSEGRFL
jgi:hypothetical protein